jgi:hypothetical protein
MALRRRVTRSAPSSGRDSTSDSGDGAAVRRRQWNASVIPGRWAQVDIVRHDLQSLTMERAEPPGARASLPADQLHARQIRRAFPLLLPAFYAGASCRCAALDETPRRNRLILHQAVLR